MGCKLLAPISTPPNHLRKFVILDCQHEQQHQELLMADALRLFVQNPLVPALWTSQGKLSLSLPKSAAWVEGLQGAVAIGQEGGDFAFDNEKPRHAVWLPRHESASRVATNAGGLAFVHDGE